MRSEGNQNARNKPTLNYQILRRHRRRRFAAVSPGVQADFIP
jgi:hypothetical protein